MSLIHQVQEYLDQNHPGLKAIELDENTATAELAAKALGVEVGQIAKTLLFKGKSDYYMVVAAGDIRIDPRRLKQVVGCRTRLAQADEVRQVTGYPVGGVCPINLKQNMKIFLDDSLERFPVVFAAAGSANSALPVTMQQLIELTDGEKVSLAGKEEI